MRYWRWTVGVKEDARAYAYLKYVRYTWPHIVLRDVGAQDFRMAFISGFAPHYCYWRTRSRIWRNTAQIEIQQ